MEQTQTIDGDREFLRRTVEAAIRIALLAGLAWWCLAIVKPFVMPVLWGAIFTVALFPIFSWLKAKAGPAVAGLETIAGRLAGERGVDLVSTSGATIRSVVQGVLGVAVIQSLLSGIGMLLVVGIPGAGLWAGLVLILAIMQLPPILVLGPAMVYVFSSASTLTAVLFLIFGLIVSGSDAFLKPLFLGRGLAIPMPVILLGAIGGMMLSGIVGLFIGAVILALGYQLIVAWVSDGTEGALTPEPESAASSA